MSLVATAWNTLRFSMGAVRPSSGPLKTQIEITHRCNSRCNSCHFWRQKAMEELAVDQWKRVLDDLKTIGCRRVAFGGGEPTLYSGICDLIRYAKSIGMLTSLGTNGLSLGEMHGEISEAGLDVIEISLDGDEVVHNQNRGLPDAFERTMAGVKAMLADKSRPVLQFNYTPNSVNVDSLETFVFTALKHGGEILSVEPAHMLNEQLSLDEQLLVPDSKIVGFDRTMRTLLKTYPDKFSPPASYYLRIPDFFRDPQEVKFCKGYRCVAGYSLLVLDPGGNVYSCPAKEVVIGNVTDKPLRDLWLSQEHIRDIKRIKAGDHKPCWLNSVSPINVFCDMVKRPMKWIKVLEIAQKELRRRL